MTTLRGQKRERGRPGAATFWWRRVVALVVALVILAVIAWAVSGVLGGGGGDGGTGAGARSDVPLEDGRLGQPGQALADAAGVRRADALHLVQVLHAGGQQLL
jgi:hypothetical protein